MANRLQLKRGTTTPGSIFYEGEPIYNKTSKVLYVGDDGGSGSGTGSAVASAAAYSAVAELLTAASSSAGGSVKFYEDTDNGNNYVALAAPAEEFAVFKSANEVTALGVVARAVDAGSWWPNTTRSRCD